MGETGRQDGSHGVRPAEDEAPGTASGVDRIEPEPERPAEPPTDGGPLTGPRAAALLFLVPSLLVLLAIFWPVITGQETLVLRDIFTTHWKMKAPQVLAFQNGEFPLIDAQRAGGQPLAGNPNAVPFYPDNLLYLVAPGLWSLNFHFWFHLLVAPFSVFWMTRAWGASRPGSWVAGVVYATSGFVLANLNFYNLIAGVALAPALVGALLTLPAVEGRRRGWVAAATALLWALLLVAGDPILAVLSAFLAGTAMIVRHGWRLGGLAPAVTLTAAVVTGTLLALPQLVEFLRILPQSFRGFQGYAGILSISGSWHPMQLMEWLVPFFFGRFDILGPGGYWGFRFYGQGLPYYISLFPGYLALVLAAASGRPRSRAAWWGWGMALLGLFLALGSANPLIQWIYEIEASKLFRYPVKLWILVALGATVLVALGFDRLFVEPEQPRIGRLLALFGGLALLLAAFLGGIVLLPGPIESWLVATRWPDATPASFAPVERNRWIATAILCFLVLVGMVLATLLARRRPRLGPALLVLVATVGQFFLLRPLFISDRMEWYHQDTPVADALPRDAVVVHGSYRDIFGHPNQDVDELFDFPGTDYRWLARHAAWQMYPFAGIPRGYHYDLDPSPEGLDSYLLLVSREFIRSVDEDPLKVRLLARWGIDHLILDRPWIDPETLEALPDDAVEGARLVGRFEQMGDVIRVHEIVDAVPRVLFAEHVLRAPEIQGAAGLFLNPRFDPRRHVVLPGEPGEAQASSGRPAWDRITDPATEAAERSPAARLVVDGTEAMEIVTDSPVPGVVVVNRSHLVLWKATVDGEPVPVEIANLYRMGIPVPAGEHRVRLWIDRGPFEASLLGSAAGLGLLLALPFLVARFAGRRTPTGEAGRD